MTQYRSLRDSNQHATLDDDLTKRFTMMKVETSDTSKHGKKKKKNGEPPPVQQVAYFEYRPGVTDMIPVNLHSH